MLLNSPQSIPVHRGTSLVDWRRGVLAYVEADDDAVEEFKKILQLCGDVENTPCVSSLAARLKVKALLYVTDLYGATNAIAFSRGVPRSSLLENAWSYLSDLLCGQGPVECDEDTHLACCAPCGATCLMARVLGRTGKGVKVDVTEQLKKALL